MSVYFQLINGFYHVCSTVISYNKLKEVDESSCLSHIPQKITHLQIIRGSCSPDYNVNASVTRAPYLGLESNLYYTLRLSVSSSISTSASVRDLSLSCVCHCWLSVHVVRARRRSTRRSCSRASRSWWRSTRTGSPKARRCPPADSSRSTGRSISTRSTCGPQWSPSTYAFASRSHLQHSFTASGFFSRVNRELLVLLSGRLL